MSKQSLQLRCQMISSRAVTSLCVVQQMENIRVFFYYSIHIFLIITLVPRLFDASINFPVYITVLLCMFQGDIASASVCSKCNKHHLYL